MPVDKSWKTNWVNEKDRQRKGLIGIWARFLQLVGVDAEASVNWDRTKASAYKSDPKICPGKCAPDPVADFIVASGFKKPVYMVTGVKIARGADVALAKSKEAGTYMRVGADGTPVGTPGAAGPEVTISLKSSEKTSFGGSSDFVFAYRLRKIFYEKGQVRHDEYNKGALYGLEDGKLDDNDATQCPPPTLEVVGIANVDTSARGLGFQEESAMDEDDEQKCTVVTAAK